MKKLHLLLSAAILAAGMGCSVVTYAAEEVAAKEAVATEAPKAAETAVVSEETKVAETAEAAKAAEDAAIREAVKALEEAKAAEAPVAAEAAKVSEAAKATEEVKAVEAPVAAEAVKVSEETKATEEVKAVEAPAVAETAKVSEEVKVAEVPAVSEEVKTAEDAAIREAVKAAGPRIMGKVVGAQVIELPVFTKVDYEKGLALDAELFGKYGCSAIYKTLANGDAVVGRSMDLYYSHKPAYIVRTAVPGYLKTVGLAYNPFIGENFSVVEAEGLTEEEVLPLLFFTTDVMNEKGLYIEGNMRAEQPKDAGFADSSGTNPGAEYRMSIAGLIRFLGERAGTVDEAVALAKTVDVYGLKNDKINWTGALYMCDATGHHGLLELVDNKLSWLDGQNAQTNFFLTPEYREKAIFGSGVGRYATLQNGIGAVRTQEDLMDLMNKVSYSQLIMKDEWTFDPRTEFTGAGEGDVYAQFGGALRIKDATAEENRDYIYNMIREYGRGERDKSIKQLKDEGVQWLSVFQLVADCTQKKLHVKFFEDPNTVLDIAL